MLGRGDAQAQRLRGGFNGNPQQGEGSAYLHGAGGARGGADDERGARDELSLGTLQPHQTTVREPEEPAQGASVTSGRSPYSVRFAG